MSLTNKTPIISVLILSAGKFNNGYFEKHSIIHCNYDDVITKKDKVKLLCLINVYMGY
jgi:hypothetical protein